MLGGRCQQWIVAQPAEGKLIVLDVCIVLFISAGPCLQRFLLLPAGAFLQDVPVLLSGSHCS